MSKNQKWPRALKKVSQSQLQREIIKLLSHKTGKFISSGVISSRLDVKNSKDSVQSALDELVKSKRVTLKDMRYGMTPGQASVMQKSKKLMLEGTIDMTSSGAAYVLVPGKPRDFYVSSKNLAHAMHRDLVLIEATEYVGGRRPEARVIRIIRRHKTNFAGVFQSYDRYGYVYVQDNQRVLEIRILPQHFNEAQSGDFVIVKITDYGTPNRPTLGGIVTTVLGQNNQNEFEMNSILINNGFNISFPEDVLRHAESLSGEIREEDLLHRRDIRDILTFTIDPFDAKDFDDAISYKVLENGNIEIGVHIADVTHFVHPNDIIDQEAYRRSTSVYLVDRVCPMLPEKLSNELCSLRPHEDKFCFSVIFTFNKENKIAEEWIGKTIIYSDRRFTYEDAQVVLENGEDELAEPLKKINQIAKQLNKERFEHGSIDFDSDEIKIILDENKRPIQLVKKQRKDAHRLIEEYMLLANKAVSRFISKKEANEIPFVYRIHDLPDDEKLNDLSILAGEYGLKMNVSTPDKVKDSLNKLSQSNLSDDIKNILKSIAIRSMAKAAYSSDNIGHYGLGFEYYSHFTSPIRRYADVLAHRILHDNLGQSSRVSKSELEDKCKYISIKERDAINAERESVRYKQVEYMESRVGEIFEGTIRNIISRGIFVELKSMGIDGLLSFSHLMESVTVHPGGIKADGDKSGFVWRVGDSITVRLISADLMSRQLEFEPVSEAQGT